MCQNRAVELENALWRALAVFRVASFAYALLLTVNNFGEYARPALGWTVLGVMAAWTALTVAGYRRLRWRTNTSVVVDLAVTAACLAATGWVLSAADRQNGAPTLTMAWVAGSVVAAAIQGGRRWAVGGAVVLGLVDMAIRGAVEQYVANGTVLLLLTGFVMAYLAALTRRAEARLQRAIELEAATRERERLSRGIHDGVLQVLALVQRRGAELGGEAAELGQLAGEQEATLRSLVRLGDGPLPADGRVDLRHTLRPLADVAVHLVTPATPVALPGPAASELSAAVASALDNVRRHAGAGAQAWVLVEDERAGVTVTVRDDGAGMVPQRIGEAERAGRLGIAQSIRGRIRDLGGDVIITTAPGKGVEVEMRVPRA